MMGVREEEWGVAGKGSEHEDARPESVLVLRSPKGIRQ